MSLRAQIIDYLRANPGATLDEIQLELGLQRAQTHDNLRHAVSEGLIERILDEVTGGVAYRLTKAGLEWKPQRRTQTSTRPDKAQRPQARYWVVIEEGADDMDVLIQNLSASMDHAMLAKLRIVEGKEIGRIELRPVIIKTSCAL